jgi:hypothetical protein
MKKPNLMDAKKKVFYKKNSYDHRTANKPQFILVELDEEYVEKFYKLQKELSIVKGYKVAKKYVMQCGLELLHNSKDLKQIAIDLKKYSDTVTKKKIKK